MASEVGICNVALQKLGANRIGSLSDTSTEATECNAVYETVRDRLIRRFSWGFARKRTQLAADATGPLFDYANSFTLPADCIRVLPPNDYDCDWVIEGRKILTNWSAPLNLVYLYRVTDPNEMDDSFREALSCALVEQLCEKITQSNVKKKDAREALRDALAEAKRIGSYEQIAQEFPEDDWITARV